MNGSKQNSRLARNLARNDMRGKKTARKKKKKRERERPDNIIFIPSSLGGCAQVPGSIHSGAIGELLIPG